MKGPSRSGPDEGERDAGELSSDVKCLVALSAALATRDQGVLRAGLEEALSEASPETVEEVLVQSYLFLGYPTALNAFALWREISGRDAPRRAGCRDWALWERRGEDVCRSVYGDQYPALRKNVGALHPDMERWMITEGYGKVLGRPGLSLRIRELCVVALLAVLAVPVQLYSHLRGSLNVGASDREVAEALEVASEYMDDEARRTARETWARVRDRMES